MPLFPEVRVSLDFYGQDEEAGVEYRRLFDAAAACGTSAVTDYRDDVGRSLSIGTSDGSTFVWEFEGLVNDITRFLHRAFPNGRLPS